MEPANSYVYKYPEGHSKRVKFAVGGFIAIIVFLILIFLLNYLNILPLYILFPSQLGWLPYKQEITRTIYEPKIPPTMLPNTKIPTVSTRFSYDKIKAEKTLENYIRDNIKKDFLPPHIDIKQSLIASGEPTGTDYEFGANWKLNDIAFSASVHLIPDTNDIRDIEFYISPQSIENISIDQANSANLVKTYLNSIPETINFDCGVFEETTKFCERFTVNGTGKSGFGTVEDADESGKNTILIFSCFIPKNDSYYNKRASCLLFREKNRNDL